MMEHTIRENINNLTSLWKKAGERTGRYEIQDSIHAVGIEKSQWPSRAWVYDPLNALQLERVHSFMKSHQVPMLFTYFDVHDDPVNGLFDEQGFQLLFEQIGMSLDMVNWATTPSNIKLIKVENVLDAHLWSKLFEQAFNYKIPPHIVAVMLSEGDYFIAYDGGEAVGTVMLYQTNQDVVGIHSMGIIPEMRRKGYGEAIMVELLNQIKEARAQHAILQSSAMGKGIYQRLGFEPEFQIYNYRI